ncbi:hypothetical protein FKP32DRAFT_1671301 [Trametes sanguinea]|nr:hypothetical protein FKP32DRAFT_1671301 [Trametes sanguinea]
MLELFETAIVNHDFGIFDGVNSAAAIHSPMSTFSCAGAHPIHRLYDARCISTRNTSLASMTLSPDSRDLLLSIFKAEPNARCAWEWRDFLKAMSELGFDIEQVDGVVFRFKAPERWQNQVVVLHMNHKRLLEKNYQNRLARRLFRKFGWCAATFRGADV